MSHFLYIVYEIYIHVCKCIRDISIMNLFYITLINSRFMDDDLIFFLFCRNLLHIIRFSILLSGVGSWSEVVSMVAVDVPQVMSGQ